MSDKIKKIKEDIEFIEDLLKDKGLTDSERKDAEDELEFAKVELAEEEGKVAEKVAHKEPKPAKVKKIKAKKEPKAPKEAKAKKSKGEIVIVVAGKEYDLNDCKQAIGALKARKHQSKSSGKKYKSKKASAKAADGIEKLIDHIEDAVPDKKIEDNPKMVIATFKAFKNKLKEAFTIIGKIISKEDATRLKNALDVIDEITDKYKD